jgi:DNA polymerase-3 subunit alpha
MNQIRKAESHVNEYQLDLFGMQPDVMEAAEIGMELPDVQDFPKQERLNREKAVLGVYLSGHPLDEYKDTISNISKDERSFITTEAFVVETDDSAAAAGGDETEAFIVQEAPKIRDNMQVCFVGVITGKQTRQTKKGDTYAIVTLEDFYGAAEMFVWPEAYTKSAEFLDEDNIVVVRGKLSMREGEAPKIMANKVTPIEVAAAYYAQKYDKMSS